MLSLMSKVPNWNDKNYSFQDQEKFISDLVNKFNKDGCGVIQSINQPGKLKRIHGNKSFEHKKFKLDYSNDHCMKISPLSKGINKRWSKIKPLINNIYTNTEKNIEKIKNDPTNDKIKYIEKMYNEMIKHYESKQEVSAAFNNEYYIKTTRDDKNVINLQNICNYGLTDKLQEILGTPIYGITTPQSIINSTFYTFNNHVEDMLLGSMSELLIGAKLWFCVPVYDEAKQIFLNIINSSTKEHKNCNAIFTQKLIFWKLPNLLSLLSKYNLKAYWHLQVEGEIMVTMPGTWHWGFSLTTCYARAINWGMIEPHQLKLTILSIQEQEKHIESKTCNCPGDEIAEMFICKLDNIKALLSSLYFFYYYIVLFILFSVFILYL